MTPNVLLELEAIIEPMSAEGTQGVRRELDSALTAMATLGQAYRGDWADFDGRVLRAQLEELTKLIRKAASGESVKSDVAAFYAWNNICQFCQCWTDHCGGH